MYKLKPRDRWSMVAGHSAITITDHAVDPAVGSVEHEGETVGDAINELLEHEHAKLRACKDALAELVRLKDLKYSDSSEGWINAEYQYAKPIAWDAARTALEEIEGE